MTRREEVEDAVGVAAGRTRDAQDRVIEELDRRGMPHAETTDTVVRRAEDLDELTHDQEREVEEAQSGMPQEPPSRA
jgi:hypothetical protein